MMGHSNSVFTTSTLAGRRSVETIGNSVAGLDSIPNQAAIGFFEHEIFRMKNMLQ